MPTSRQLLGSRGVRVGRRRWVLDRYRRAAPLAGRRWSAGWVRAGAAGATSVVGVSVVGPRHGLALAHLDW